MAVSSAGEMAGSVSGGCVEGAVVAAALETIQTGMPKLLKYGVTDETAWDVGLACGGEVEIFVDVLDSIVYEFIKSQLKKGYALHLGFVIDDPGKQSGLAFSASQSGEKIEFAHSRLVAADVSMEATDSKRITRSIDDVSSTEIFIDVIQPAQTLIIVGGVHIAIPLVTIAKTLGFSTIVVDPRKKFASQSRFPHADQIVNVWPQQAFSDIRITAATAAAVLTHDPKIDDPALEILLPSEAFYVGALGSKKTQAQRRERLVDAGIPENQINRLYGPIGLNLGGRSPDEIALAIMAEIIQVRNN